MHVFIVHFPLCTYMWLHVHACVVVCVGRLDLWHVCVSAPDGRLHVSVHVIHVIVSFLFVCVGIYSHVGLWMWLCDGVCTFISVTLCMCMCVRVRGSLVSLLNIKQLEVIKYLGSTGSLWILILPFPSVSQISLFFPIFLFLFFLPVTPSLHPDSHSLYLSFSTTTSLLVLSPFACLVQTHALTRPNSLIAVSLTLFMRESQSFNWESVLPAGTQGDGERREEVDLCHSVMLAAMVALCVGISSVTSPLRHQAVRVHHSAPCHVKHKLGQQADGCNGSRTSRDTGPFGRTTMGACGSNFTGLCSIQKFSPYWHF